MRKMTMTLVLLVISIGLAYANPPITDTDPRGLIESRHKMFHKLLNESPDMSETQIREEVRDVLSSFMDFDEIARLALRRHFKDLSATQRARFTASFKRLIQTSYMKRLKPGMHYEMTVLAAPEVRNGKARVRTLLKSGNTEFEVDYLLRQNYLGGVWRSYDIVIDGVSMVRNYRKALYSLMKEHGFEAMMSRIDEKIKEREWWVKQ